MKKIFAALLFCLPLFASAESLPELTRRVIELEEKAGYYDRHLRAYYDGLATGTTLAEGCDSVFEALLAPRFLFLGDQHDIPDPVDYLEQVAREKARRGEKPALVIELIFRQYQASIDAFLAGRASLEELRRESHFDDFGWAWKWESISRALSLGR